ncbi:hypothetical protein PHYPO_G00109970 [Pangasianodon hypophthalmus]|uniref:Uncharacterized protein n=1 Tax=Pangasianodon hypophthalmus TaxID=310915 RepID=A0A5N5PY04_PANHP|nr:hypothetical protein PHYPO_G00109970 [Pangasianodon hypophthalmus]
MKLLALVLLLSAFSSPTLAEVVKEFDKSKCSEFFIQSPNRKIAITPTVFTEKEYKQICQRWNNRYRFATLYDTQRRIPVYSAYTFSGGEHNDRNGEWKNEPQLENSTKGPDMEKISDEDMDEFSYQAVNRDYEESKSNTNTEYTRGHVFPNQGGSKSTQLPLVENMLAEKMSGRMNLKWIKSY